MIRQKYLNRRHVRFQKNFHRQIIDEIQTIPMIPIVYRIIFKQRKVDRVASIPVQHHRVHTVEVKVLFHLLMNRQWQKHVVFSIF